MAINLEKEKHIEVRKTDFTDEDFADINLNNIINNERIFIPYHELPDSEEQRTSYLDNLVSFIERKTERHCSYFIVSEGEPYEVSGFYIQSAPELKDRNGEYVRNNDYVYDKDGVKWHVNYYCKNNQLCILVDNNSGYAVVPSLSDFSLNLDDGSAETAENCIQLEIKSETHYAFNIGAVIAGVLFVVLTMIAVVFICFRLSDGFEMLSDLVKESSQTQSDSEISFTDTFTIALREAMPILKKMLPLSILIFSMYTTIKRLMDRRF